MSYDNDTKPKGLYVPKWWEKRLPFFWNISLGIGSTMFDFALFNGVDILSVGFFWIHLDIQVGD